MRGRVDFCPTSLSVEGSFSKSDSSESDSSVKVDSEEHSELEEPAGLIDVDAPIAACCNVGNNGCGSSIGLPSFSFVIMAASDILRLADGVTSFNTGITDSGIAEDTVSISTLPAAARGAIGVGILGIGGTVKILFAVTSSSLSVSISPSSSSLLFSIAGASSVLGTIAATVVEGAGILMVSSVSVLNLGDTSRPVTVSWLSSYLPLSSSLSFTPFFLVVAFSVAAVDVPFNDKRFGLGGRKQLGNFAVGFLYRSC